MKLVDILARELDEWPDGCDWVVCVRREGALCASFGTGNLPKPDTADRNDHTWTILESELPIRWAHVHKNIDNAPCDRLESVVVRDQWQAAVNAHKVAESATPEWSEGLPQVGQICEARKRTPNNSGEWISGDVRYLSDCTIVIGGHGREYVHHPRTLEFRPFSPPEKTIDAERESAIKAFMKIGDIYYCDAEKLYDAGARFPQTSKGE